MLYVISLSLSLRGSYMTLSKCVLQLKGCMEGTRKWLFSPNFFPCPNELNFCMWPSTSENNIPPYLSLLVSLSFSRNNLGKNEVFFLAVSFPKKAFVFPNNRISEACICRQGWFKKISRKRKTKQQKKLRGNVYFLKSKVTCKSWGHLEAKQKTGLQSHLRGSSTQPFNLPLEKTSRSLETNQNCCGNQSITKKWSHGRAYQN